MIAVPMTGSRQVCPPRQATMIAYYDESGFTAPLFDAVSSADPMVKGDVQFYAELAGEPGKRVLELGCGTGRVAVPLAASGHSVVGLDTSPAMLKLAEQKRKALPSAIARRLDFRLGDMTSFSQQDPFDLVLVPFFGLNHVLRDPDRAQAFELLAKHLLASGRAAIHYAPSSMLRFAAQMPLEQKRGYRIVDGEGRSVRVRPIEQRADEHAGVFVQLNEYVLRTSSGAVMTRTEEKLVYALLADAEIDAHIRRAGLCIMQEFSRFEEAGTGIAGRILVIAKA